MQTDKNIICAVKIFQPNRRNLFVYYLPVTEIWQEKVMSDEKNEYGTRLQKTDEHGEPVYRLRINCETPILSHSAFWKRRGGLTAYSELQEDFYNRISSPYGAVRGKSTSLIKIPRKNKSVVITANRATLTTKNISTIARIKNFKGGICEKGTTPGRKRTSYLHTIKNKEI